MCLCVVLVCSEMILIHRFCLCGIKEDVVTTEYIMIR